MRGLATLEALLRAYSPDAAGKERHDLDRMLVLLRSASDPFARSNFVPGHFTASGFVLSKDGSSLLLIHHRKLERWLQPGGHVEASDADIVAAARRELAEEVGLAGLELESPGIFNLDVHAIPALGVEPAHEHFDVRFLFRTPGDELRANHEVKAARWFPLHAIDAAASDESVARAATKLLSRNLQRAQPS